MSKQMTEITSLHSEVTSLQEVVAGLKAGEICNDVIISGLAESVNGKKDAEEVNKICEQATVNTKPIGLQRLGKRGDRPKLLTLTFPSTFDARVFRSKVAETVKYDASPLSNLKCRPGRTKDEREEYRKDSEQAEQCNHRSWCQC
ncbi:hypothetical protein CAPTEDRAFT_189216 [Capitella teleta]|uniref:Uncharacterized protein n=1 Tax=Capitella teleta TaxID=283909 RepID=R7T9T9_CAPTE|nr:hypothetical protein CAPTEDRAFT_189216 [Capitella teleta]|eukprot:ELT90518.1 hypothetical protein CAPTEDRAFT_189216 [Capitella teleta]